MAFRMQPTALPDRETVFEPLCFEAHTLQGRNASRAFNPVLAATVGAELEYGSLFAYLFRRFGYPNQTWDGPTELACYLLSTPRCDLFLRVVPRIDGRTDRCLEFLAPSSVAQAARGYVRGEADLWEGRALLHYAAAAGMPLWLKVRAEALGLGVVIAASGPVDAAACWRLALRTRPDDSAAAARRAHVFLQQCRDGYGRLEPCPGIVERPVSLAAWAESDPLKPYAIAAVHALRNLLRGVRIGEAAIDVFGPRPATAHCLAAASSAGIACGGLVKRDVRLCYELHRLVEDLGGGDARRSLARAVAALKVARKP